MKSRLYRSIYDLTTSSSSPSRMPLSPSKLILPNFDPGQPYSLYSSLTALSGSRFQVSTGCDSDRCPRMSTDFEIVLCDIEFARKDAAPQGVSAGRRQFLAACQSCLCVTHQVLSYGDSVCHHGNTQSGRNASYSICPNKERDWKVPRVYVCACVTLRVQQSLYPQVLLCPAEGVFQPVDGRRLPLHRAPIKKLRSAATKDRD